MKTDSSKPDPRVYIEEFRRLRARIQEGDNKARSRAWHIASSLEQTARVSVYDDMLELVRDQAYGTARQMLPYAIAKLKTRRKRSIPLLAELLPDPDLTSQIMDVLGRLGAAEYGEKIQLYRDDPDMRPVAEKTLRRLGLLPTISDELLSTWRTTAQFIDANILDHHTVEIDLDDLEDYLKRISEVLDAGLSETDVTYLVSHITDMELDATENLGFRVTYDGVPDIPLLVYAFMDDVDTPDISISSRNSFTEVLLTLAPLIENEPYISATIKRKTGLIPDSLRSKLRPIHLACVDGDFQAVRDSLADLTDVDTPEELHGNTPLMLAAFNDHPDIVAFLLENGANPECRCDNDNPVLLKAAWGGATSSARILIKAGAKIDERECDLQLTPLCVAAAHGHFQVVELLIGAGAALTACDKTGYTALASAFRSNCLATARLLKRAERVQRGEFFSIEDVPDDPVEPGDFLAGLQAPLTTVDQLPEFLRFVSHSIRSGLPRAAVRCPSGKHELRLSTRDVVSVADAGLAGVTAASARARTACGT